MAGYSINSAEYSDYQTANHLPVTCCVCQLFWSCRQQFFLSADCSHLLLVYFGLLLGPAMPAMPDTSFNVQLCCSAGDIY